MRTYSYSLRKATLSTKVIMLAMLGSIITLFLNYYTTSMSVFL